MAKMTGNAFAVAMCEALGIDHREVRRLVLDIQAGALPIVHVEMLGSDKLLEVVRALDGVQVDIVGREPAEVA